MCYSLAKPVCPQVVSKEPSRRPAILWMGRISCHLCHACAYRNASLMWYQSAMAEAGCNWACYFMSKKEQIENIIKCCWISKHYSPRKCSVARKVKGVKNLCVFFFCCYLRNIEIVTEELLLISVSAVLRTDSGCSSQLSDTIGNTAHLPCRQNGVKAQPGDRCYRAYCQTINHQMLIRNTGVALTVFELPCNCCL